MPVYLKALALRNYRGIGSSIQKMPEFKTFNFFIGANNAGKSTILNFISKYLPPDVGPQTSRKSRNIDSLEYHGGVSGHPIYMALGYTFEQVWHCLSLRHGRLLEDARQAENLETVIRAISDEHGMIWKGTDLPYKEQLALPPADLEELRTRLPKYEWQRLWSALTQRGEGDINRHWIPETISAIDQALDISMPCVRLIPAIRQIGPKDAAFEDFSGVGLIDQLASIQNPEHDRRADRMKFDRINGFLRFVTGKTDAEIEIPYSRDHILVHMDDRILPLNSLGTGIHEVIMIAAFCTLAENEIICIEEPELHLHPLLQRKLITYLEQETDNQYFIATHSAAFIDTPGAAIFHVTLDNNTTCIREAVLRQDRFAICTDLGHRASDIIQANAVIWVEGPSDRIYLRHWISTLAPDLAEGIHYSIMFYGGRLLSHLSADDEEISEFIQLRSLNRHLAIVMDSDKSSPQTRINATKRRLVNEFRLHGGIAWVTKGREIENYIEHDRLQRAVRSVYGSKYGAPLSGSPYDHALHFRRATPKRKPTQSLSSELIERDVDKVKVGRAVVDDGQANIGVLDLAQRAAELVAMIKGANA